MSYVPEKHHGAQSPVQFFGIPFWLSLIILVSGLTVGVLLSTASGDLGLTYKICFVVAVLFVAITTEPRSIFLTVACTPLLFVTATVIALLLLARQSSSGASSVTSQIIHLYPLLEQFPVLISTTIVAALIGLIRLFLLKKTRHQTVETATRERRQADELSKRNTAQANRARSQSQRSEVRSAKDRARNRATATDTTVTVEELLKRNNPKEDTNASSSLISPATGVTQVIKPNRATESGGAAASTMPGRNTTRRDNHEGTTPPKPKIQRRPAGSTGEQRPVTQQVPRKATRPAQHPPQQQRTRRRVTPVQDPQRHAAAAGQQTNRTQRPANTQQTRQGRTIQPPRNERSTMQPRPQSSSAQARQHQPRTSQPADRLRSNPNGTPAVNKQRSPQQRAQARNAQQRGSQPRVQQRTAHSTTPHERSRNPQRGQQRNPQQRSPQQRAEHHHASQMQTGQQRDPRRRNAQQRVEQNRTSSQQRAAQQRSTQQRSPQQRTRQQQQSPHTDAKREQPRQRRRRSLNDDLYS